MAATNQRPQPPGSRPPTTRDAMHGETWVLLVRTEQEEEEEKKTWTIEARQISGTEDKSKDRYYLGRLLRPAVAQWAYSCTSPLKEKTPGPTRGFSGMKLQNQ